MEISSTTERTTAGAEHYHALDSLRGIAALLVMGLHFPSASRLVDNALVHNAWLFVDFFFVLSGFVIAASYGNRLRAGYGLGRFILLRLGRLYPTHLVILVGSILFNVAILQLGLMPASRLGRLFDANGMIGIVQSLTLTWAIALYDPQIWIGTSWSISVEFWMYVIAAVVFRAAGARATLVFALVAAAAALALAATGDGNLLRVDAFSLVRGLLGFSCGVICHALRGRLAAWAGGGAAGWTAAELSLTALTLAAVALLGATTANLALPFLFLPVVLVFSLGRGAMSRALETPVPRFLGLISYPLYLVHFYLVFRFLNVMQLVQGRTGWRLTEARSTGGFVFASTSWWGTAAAVSCIAVVIFAATLIHYLVEEPGRRWSRRLVAARSVRAAEGR